MTGSVWLPLSRDIQKATEIFVQLTCGSPVVSNEAQILRLRSEWRVAAYFRETGAAQTLMFKRAQNGLLQVHEITKMPLTWFVLLPVRTTMNRMSG